ARRERDRSGPLHECRGAGHRVRYELRDRLDERARKHAVPETPSGHRERLAESIEQDGALSHALLDRDRAVLAVVHELAVDLVRKDPEIALARDGRDVADRVTREHATRRVVGTVEDEHLGPRIHEPAELVD